MTADASAVPGAEAEGTAVADAASSTPAQQLTFSPGAIEERESVLAEYRRRLDQTSIASALQPPKSDIVSRSNVQWAVALLGLSRGNTRTKHIGELGLLLMGAGLGILGALFLTWQFTVPNLAICVAPLLVGSVMYAYAWGRE